MADLPYETLAISLAGHGGQLSYITAVWARYEQKGLVEAEPAAGSYGPPYRVTLTADGERALKSR